MIKKNTVSYGPMMVTIFLGAFLVTLSTSTINLALPFLMKHFNTTLDTVKWTLTGFMLAMGTMAPITAYLGERFSYKRVYLLSIIGFTLASVLCIFSWNITSLIIFRILQGAFSGIITPATMAIIYQVIPKEKQVGAISLWSTAAMLAPAVGPTLSGFLIQYFNWQSIFMINIPLGIITAIIGSKYIPYFKLNVPKFFDFKGFVAIIIGSLALLVAFSEGGTLGWNSWIIITAMVVGVIALGLFIWRALSIESPVLDIRVFKYSKYTLSTIVYSFVMMSLYAGTLLTPLFLQNIQQMSALDAGLIMLPASLAMALTMPIVGRLYSKMDSRILIGIGVLLMAIGSWEMGHLSINTSHGYVMLWMIVRNIGISFGTMPVTYSGMAVLPKTMSGHGSAVNNWISRVVSSLSMAVFASLLTSRATTHIIDLIKSGRVSQELAKSEGFVLGINDLFVISFAIILISLPISYFLGNKEKNNTNNKYEILKNAYLEYINELTELIL